MGDFWDEFNMSANQQMLAAGGVGNSYIATPTATPAIGTAFEGGYYTGMIWNELVQSSTSTVIGTGSKAFTVANMAATPIVYSGQTLEVRSRANPVNKLVGTVSSAIGTTLTLNITSVGGSGTFTDWSIMAQYRVIVAPKATGENASIAWKNDQSDDPSACATLTEGSKATAAMVAAGNSTVYPAAHWCNDLNTGGQTDWYLPARDELELCWRNLKPTTNNNYTTADRSSSAIAANLGSYGDTATTHGTNNNSSPARSAYTTSVPGQTAATAFRVGGAEAFNSAAGAYWSCTQWPTSSGFAWQQRMTSTFDGYQVVQNVSLTGIVRAVRRSII